MDYNIYSVKDKVAGHFGPLFIESNNDSAIRSIVQNYNSKVPYKDYELYLVGVFNQISGCVTGFPDGKVQLIGNVYELIIDSDYFDDSEVKK